MSAVDTWPLSAAATQLLLNLRDGGPPITSALTISRLTVKELVVRGELHVIGLRKRRLRAPVVTVASSATPPSIELPAPVYLLATRLPRTPGEDLAKVVRKASKKYTKLFSHELKASALGELVQAGLAEERYRKVLGFWPSSFHAPTPLGEQWAARARQDATHAASLGALVESDPETAFRVARALGTLLLVVPGGLAIAVALAHKWRDGLGHGLDAAVSMGDFDILESLGNGLGDLLESLGRIDASTFDASFDAIGSAVDSGIDSGVSDGGGDGGSGGGSDGGGGGCGGGGCGGGG